MRISKNHDALIVVMCDGLAGFLKKPKAITSTKPIPLMAAMVRPIFLLSPKMTCVVEGGWVGVGVGRGVLVGIAVRLGTKPLVVGWWG
jgi:hypothetical protein